MLQNMKTRVLKVEEPIEELSAAYMKLLREKDATKRVYDIDPYCEVYRFRENVYGLLTDSLDGMGAPWMYLIIGPEKALLVDTSFGLGNLKGLVNELSGGMDLIVVNTHASFDHSYGNCQFERAYCHEYCVPYMEKQLSPHIWDYLFNEDGSCKWTEFERKDLIFYKPYEIVGCPNGHIFNLGKDYDVELVFLPGHQAGHAGFLDKTNRILFCGDDFISMRVGIGGPKEGMPYGEYATVTALRNELEKLVKRIDEFDALFPGHFIVDIGSTVVQNLLDTCNAVISNPGNYDFLFTVKGKTSKQKFIKGLGTLGYSDISV
jgi:glyoxylase-like metal-dependent hydrolase (beta-lactamase superfamily II)